MISRHGVQTNPQKLKAFTDIQSPKTKKELQAFLGIINYLGKFSPSTAEVCESLRKLTSAKTKWTWNTTYQKMFYQATAIIKEDSCMKFYYETQPLYIETDASGVGLGAALLEPSSNTNCHRGEAQDNSILRVNAFLSKSLTRAEKRYSNTESKALGILYGLEKFHHYCFAREVSIITYHKPLIAIFKKDMAILSQRLHQILLRIHQYRMRIIYKPGPELLAVQT